MNAGTSLEEVGKPAESSATAKPKALKATTVNAVAVAVAIAMAIVAMVVTALLLNATAQSEEAHKRYEECSHAASELMSASDFLTTQSRMYVVTGEEMYLDSYLDEILITKRRDKAVETLNKDAEDALAAKDLEKALGESNDLAIRELYAMRLTAEAMGVDPMPQSLSMVVLSDDDEKAANEGKAARARQMVLGDEYSKLKDLIERDVNKCANELVQGVEQKEIGIEHRIDRLLATLLVVVVLLVCIVILTALANRYLVMRPMMTHAKNIAHNQPLDMVGSAEIQKVVSEYNKMYEQIQARTKELQHEAETDALTGVLNRGSYDKLLEQYRGDFALVIADIDHFKQINDKHGHTIGDKVLKRFADSIKDNFRSTDQLCRIGGDEFAIIVTGATTDSRDAIVKKLESISKEMAEPPDDLPPVAVSYGIAFSADLPKDGNIYHAADEALYKAKRGGRNQSAFYGE